MACVYFFSKVLICSGWFNRPNIFSILASLAAHFPSSINYMFMYCFFITTAFSILASSSTKHTSLFTIFRFSSIEAVLHLAVFTTASSCGSSRFDSCCDSLMSSKQVVRSPLPNARYKV